MLLRAATTEDVPTLADAWYAMLDELEMLDAPQRGWRDLLIADFTTGILRGSQRWMAIEEDERVVAVGGLFFRRDPISVALTGLTATIGGVYTWVAYRRRGYAGTIVANLLRVAREAGCRDVRLRASSQGRALYERAGFLPSDEMYLALR